MRWMMVVDFFLISSIISSHIPSSHLPSHPSSHLISPYLPTLDWDVFALDIFSKDVRQMVGKYDLNVNDLRFDEEKRW